MVGGLCQALKVCMKVGEGSRADVQAEDCLQKSLPTWNIALEGPGHLEPESYSI